VRGFRIPSQLNQNGSDYSVQIGHHVSIGEPKHAIALRLESQRSRSVVRFAPTVGVAIHFDNQTLRARSEVRDIGRKDNLSLELHADTIGTNCVPQLPFWRSKIRAQPLCARSSFDVPLQRAPSPVSKNTMPPSMAFFDTPLPLKGERGSDRHRFNSVHGNLAVNA